MAVTKLEINYVSGNASELGSRASIRTDDIFVHFSNCSNLVSPS